MAQAQMHILYGKQGKFVCQLLISNFLFQVVTRETSLSLMYKYFANQLQI